MADDAPTPKPEIDEKFIGEWLKFGFAEMHIYMVKHAQFDAWLLRHPKLEEPDGSSSTPQG